ncbi:MAG: hypothetical protein Q8936_15475 [Bacillota bacterium]|nr:hypothetical protein [Bacillota bacterium]
MGILIIQLIAGVLINIFIGKLATVIFRKDNRSARIPLRFIGLFLVINSVIGLSHILR